MLIGLIAGCSKAHEQEIQNVRRALHQAIISGAEQYAPNELKQAQDSLIEVQTKIENKDYKSAKKLAIEAKEKAVYAQEKARQAEKRN